MLRAYLEPVFFLFLPFLLYGVFLFLRARFPALALPAFSVRTRALWLAGLVLALASFVGLTLLKPQRQGTYVPAHVEGGRLVPGYLKEGSNP